MIAVLRGEVYSIDEDKVIIMAGGVGYVVTCSQNAIDSLRNKKGDAELSIYTQVSEHAIDLYGFYEKLEKDMFKRLISVSGIGPKAGMALVSSLGVRALVSHIFSGNEKELVKAPGIGKKSAKRIVLELAPEMDKWRTKFSKPMETIGVGHTKGVEQAVAALIQLGYKSIDINPIIHELQMEFDTGADISRLVRKGLQLLRKEP